MAEAEPRRIRSHTEATLTAARILTWNVEWKRPEGPKGRLIREVLRDIDPDVAVLTEANGRYFEAGHLVEAVPDWGYGERGARRKVSMWSREPWTDVDTVGHSALPPGRFVRGWTSTPIGDIEVIGVCVPWFGSHVRHGRRDRARWQEHRTYLEALDHYLGAPYRAVVAGDFNQRVPRRRQPVETYELLRRALDGAADIVTDGEIDGLEAPLIDHVAIAAHLVATKVTGIPAERPSHGRLSDHAGVVVEIENRVLRMRLSDAELRSLRRDTRKADERLRIAFPRSRATSFDHDG